MKRFDKALEYMRTSLWVIPAAAAVLAVIAGIGSVAIDDATDASFAFGGDVAAARSVLTTIAASMITFTGLVFSITIVALQLASDQFSPRVMRTFLRDRTSKMALATFVATFSFAFTVLGSARTNAVPGISVAIAIVLVFVSVGVFVVYISHTAHAIRASAIIGSVAAETRATLDRLYPEEEATPGLAAPALGAAGRPVANAANPGVVTGFDAEGIADWAAAIDAEVVLHAGVGDFVPTGAPMLELHGADPCDWPEEFISVAQDRTMQQDAAFGLRQLVDLAVKALSPGINDPTTAVQAIDQIHDVLRRLATRPWPSGRVADEDGRVRLVFPTPSWEDFVSLATDEIRIYGSGSLQVVRRLEAMLEDLLVVAAEDRRQPLRAQLELLPATTERGFAA